MILEEEHADQGRNDQRQRDSEPPSRKLDAAAINDRGQIVGWSTTTSGKHAPSRAFVWQNGKMTILPALGGRYSYSSEPQAINNRGQIVGTAFAKTANDQRAVLWTLQPGR